MEQVDEQPARSAMHWSWSSFNADLPSATVPSWSLATTIHNGTGFLTVLADIGKVFPFWDSGPSAPGDAAIRGMHDSTRQERLLAPERTPVKAEGVLAYKIRTDISAIKRALVNNQSPNL